MFTGLVGAVSKNKRAEKPDEEMTLHDSFDIGLFAQVFFGWQDKRNGIRKKKCVLSCTIELWVSINVDLTIPNEFPS